LPGPRPSPVDAADTPTRERLLRAARQLIEERGYTFVSVAAVAQRAGLATGALYRHFPSKAALFVEVFRDAGERMLLEMYEAQSRHDRFGDRLDAVIAAFATTALANRRLVWALVYEPVDAVVDAERLAYRRSYREHMGDLLDQGISSGEIPHQDSSLSAAALVGAIAETLVGPLSLGQDAAAADAGTVARLQDFCRRAIAANARGEPETTDGAPAP
jgi:AcrR family transcriptional regulator